MFELFDWENELRLASSTTVFGYVSVLIVMTGKSLLAFPTIPSGWLGRLTP